MGNYRAMRLPMALAAATTLAFGMQFGASASPAAVPVAKLVKHIYPAINTVKAHLGDKGYIGGTNGFGKLQYGGGPVEHTPKVFITYWGWHGVDPKGEAAYLQGFLGGVGGTPWANIQTQYTDSRGRLTNPTGQLAGFWYDDSSTPATITADADIAAEGVKAAQHFGYNGDADYFVATPSGTGTSGFAAKGGSYCAYHSSTASSLGVVAFTYMPYMTDAGTSCGQNYVNAGSAGILDGVSIVGGHEYAEAVTDPQPASGWTDITGAENGDKCAWTGTGGVGGAQNITVSGGAKYAVQGLWSNAYKSGLFSNGGCVVKYP